MRFPNIWKICQCGSFQISQAYKFPLCTMTTLWHRGLPGKKYSPKVLSVLHIAWLCNFWTALFLPCRGDLTKIYQPISVSASFTINRCWLMNSVSHSRYSWRTSILCQTVPCAQESKVCLPTFIQYLCLKHLETRETWKVEQAEFLPPRTHSHKRKLTMQKN